MSYSSQRKELNALPAEVAEFVGLLRGLLPAAEVATEAGGVKAGNWWLECSHGKVHVTVEWRPGRGFGISDPDVEPGYGEGPEEVFRDVQLAVRRLAQWLRASSDKGEARPSWLRQLREIHGISQIELAERLKVNQAAVSRMENREDWKVATLLAVVEAMGGRMQVVAHFKNCDIPVRLPGTELGAAVAWELAETEAGR